MQAYNGQILWNGQKKQEIQCLYAISQFVQVLSYLLRIVKCGSAALFMTSANVVVSGKLGKQREERVWMILASWA